MFKNNIHITGNLRSRREQKLLMVFHNVNNLILRYFLSLSFHVSFFYITIITLFLPFHMLIFHLIVHKKHAAKIL